MKRKAIVFLLSLLLICGVCIFICLFDFDSQRASGKNVVEFCEKPDLPTVILDAGHGGIDGGAVGVDGTNEKDINLSITLKTDEMLRAAGFNTLLVRDSDTLICDDGLSSVREKKSSDLHNRMKIMEQTDNCLFLSIHQNSYPSASSNGTQVFYSPNDEASGQIALSLQNTVRSLLQPDNKRKTKKSTTSVYLLYYATKPAVMVECGFITNAEDCRKLNDEDYQNKMAFAIACSLIEYYGGQKV